MTALSSQTAVRVVRDVAEWDRLSPEWNDLWDISPAKSPPLHFDWMRRWWDIYGDTYRNRDRGLVLVTVRRDSRLVGVLPLYLRGRQGMWGLRTLGFISTGEDESEETCAEYLDLLHAPEEAESCLHSVAPALSALTPRWDEMVLTDFPASSQLHHWTAAPSRGRLVIQARGECPIADLSGGFDAYLKRLTPKTRQHCRQYLRGLDKANASFDVATEQTFDEMFDDLVRLHQERWQAVGKPGCFASDRFTRFHKSLARMWLPSGRAVLAPVRHEGVSIAVIYGFIAGTKFDYYQSGLRVEEKGPVPSPGTAIIMRLMLHLIERGVDKFDFLRGSSVYKQKFATEQRSLCRLRLVRVGVRTSLQRVSKSLHSGACTMVRKVRNGDALAVNDRNAGTVAAIDASQPRASESSSL